MSHPNLKNITPGEILLEDYMKPMGLSQNALARALDVPPRRINEIIHGKRAITLDTSLRLARYFGQSPRFWLNTQSECDLRNAKELQEQIFGRFSLVSPHRIFEFWGRVRRSLSGSYLYVAKGYATMRMRL